MLKQDRLSKKGQSQNHWLTNFKTALMASVISFCTLFSVISNASVVKSMRFWQSPESTRVVLDLSGAVEHKIDVLKNPHRIVIDLPASSVAVDLSELEIKSDLIKKVRQSKPVKAGDLRLVLDLSKEATPKSFSLKPYQDYGDRLVIDLFDKKKEVAKTEPKVAPKEDLKRDIVIAVDAGHGGDDPGALGPSGTREKDVVLKLSKDIVAEINKEKGLKAILTRTGDYYLRHRKRTDIARKHRADLFVSVHADGFKSPKARGASVWILNTRGVKSEIARWMRLQEEKSELLGGVDSKITLSDYDSSVRSVLLDLQMDNSIAESMQVAKKVHKNMSKIAPKMHKPHVEENNLLVLKNPDIPSILVESGFITNPGEEKLLKSKKYRQKLAKSVKNGIKSYFKENAPDGTLYAAKYRKNVYLVQRGDSLSKVARRFDVTIRELKVANKLRSNNVRIGQKLIIPSSAN